MSIVVTHEGGVKFAAQIRDHRVLVDQSARGGGDDAAPTPLELLGAALGTCVALYVRQFCHTRELSYESMRVEVDTTDAKTPHRIGQFDVRVVLPAEFPEPYREMIDRVARSCPVHNTLAHSARINVALTPTSS